MFTENSIFLCFRCGQENNVYIRPQVSAVILDQSIDEQKDQETEGKRKAGATVSIADRAKIRLILDENPRR